MGQISSHSKLLAAAKLALMNSYSPYSGYRVAASLETDQGEIVAGCNIENASYGATVCAERVAIWKAISLGAKSIKTLLVYTESENPWPPCGLCRQVLAEFASPEAEVLIAGVKGVARSLKFSELLPLAFTPKNLTKNKD